MKFILFKKRGLYNGNYIDGSISGFYSQDTIIVAGLTVKNQYLVEITAQTTKSFKATQFDVEKKLIFLILMKP